VLEYKGLLELQKFDLLIDEIDEKIRKQTEKVERLALEIGKEEELLKDKEALLKKITLRKRKGESELNATEEKIKTIDMKMRCAGVSPDTYQALQRELDSAKEKFSKLETQVLEDMEKIEILEKDIQKGTKVNAGRKLQLEESRKKAQEQTFELRKEKELLDVQRKQISLKIAADQLEIYEELRRKVNRKVLWDTDKPSCPACGMHLPESFLSSIIGFDEAEPCPHCGVYLHWTGILDGIHA